MKGPLWQTGSIRLKRMYGLLCRNASWTAVNGKFWDILLSQWDKSPVEIYQTNVNLKYIVHHRLLPSCSACLNMACETSVWHFVDINEPMQRYI